MILVSRLAGPARLHHFSDLGQIQMGLARSPENGPDTTGPGLGYLDKNAFVCVGNHWSGVLFKTVTVQLYFSGESLLNNLPLRFVKYQLIWPVVGAVLRFRLHPK
jgi:hypothetical protein